MKRIAEALTAVGAAVAMLGLALPWTTTTSRYTGLGGPGAMVGPTVSSSNGLGSTTATVFLVLMGVTLGLVAYRVLTAMPRGGAGRALGLVTPAVVLAGCVTLALLVHQTTDLMAMYNAEYSGQGITDVLSWGWLVSAAGVTLALGASVRSAAGHLADKAPDPG